MTAGRVATYGRPISQASWRQSHAKLQGQCGRDVHKRQWKVGGGPERDYSVLVEVELDKVRKEGLITRLEE